MGRPAASTVVDIKAEDTGQSQVTSQAVADAIPLQHYIQTPIPDILRQWQVDPKQGLSSADAAARLTTFGPNELEKDPPEPWWKKLWTQLTDLLVVMLIAASIVSIALGDYAEGIIIIMIVILNAALGVYQEGRAEEALEALQTLASPAVTVIRDGQIATVSSSSVVPGDIVILETGNKIVADIRLIESAGLSSNEAPLTGESEPANKNATFLPAEKVDLTTFASPSVAAAAGQNKDKILKAHKARAKDEEEGDEVEMTTTGSTPNGKAKEEQKEKEKPAAEGKKEGKLTDPNMVYFGCTIQDGNGKGVVVKTGMSTKMGEIAELIKSAEDKETPIHAKLHALGVRLGIASIACSVIVLLVGIFARGIDWLEMVLVAVSLTVAAVPEGLPACVTITLAVGMKNMVKKNALIRDLGSVETLGSATVICTDKTGTLTKGIMTAVRLWYGGQTLKITGAGYDPSGYILPMDTDEANPTDVLKQSGAATRRLPHMQPLLVGLLCSNATLQYNQEKKEWECLGNSSERPLVVAAKKAGFDASELEPAYTQLKENPFNAARKMMSKLYQVQQDKAQPLLRAPFVACIKGAPNMVLEKCNSIAVPLDGANGFTVKTLTPADREQIMKVVDEFSEKAFRVLALAYCSYSSKPSSDDADALEKNLVLAGLVASIDPERPEVAPSIRKAAIAGVRTVMITGDYVKTARAIAENINLLPHNAAADKAVDCAVVRQYGDQVEALTKELRGIPRNEKDRREELKIKRAQLESEIDKITANADVFARAKPVDKITIVRSLQRQGHVCSMTGDGVNDAPALKQADIGVAMGITGTDVAKAASSMVLTDDNFVSIVNAIEEGRTIYGNITKFVYYLLSTNVSEVLTILVAVLAGLESPLVPIQILWLNLVTDGAPAIALALEPMDPSVMEQGPRLRTEPIIEKLQMTGMIIQNTILTGCCLCAYVLGLKWNTGSWDGHKPHLPDGTPQAIIDLVDEAHSDGMKQATTMVIYTIVFSELLRAYTCRSLRESLWRIGPFTNKWMQPGSLGALVITVVVGHIPVVREVFNMQLMDGRQWGTVIGLCFIPAISDEFAKWIYRRTGFGLRPKPQLASQFLTSADAKHAEKHGSLTNGSCSYQFGVGTEGATSISAAVSPSLTEGRITGTRSDKYNRASGGSGSLLLNPAIGGDVLPNTVPDDDYKQ